MTIRINLWSGPRNISTAMMRAFENRPDCAVIDEPFYGVYLAETGISHPFRDETLAAWPTDWRSVLSWLSVPPAGGEPILYAKQMSHHMLGAIPLDWLSECRNAFLIRAPEEVVASYAARRSQVTGGDLGYERLVELFDIEADRRGEAPPVVEARDVLADPGTALASLCAALAIPFDRAMLAWPAGPRASDGPWAPAWYGAVERSTGFGRLASPVAAANLDPALRAIAAEARPHYDRLARHRLRI